MHAPDRIYSNTCTRFFDIKCLLMFHRVEKLSCPSQIYHVKAQNLCCFIIELFSTSLFFQVNKGMVVHFLYIHCMLYTNIGYDASISFFGIVLCKQIISDDVFSNAYSNL